MSEDRSRRDHVEQGLSEERFRIAQIAGGIGWFEWDLMTDAWEWTPHVAVLFGFDPARSRPQLSDWHPAIFIDDVAKLRSAVEQAGAEAPYYVEFRVNHPDGSVHSITISANVKPLKPGCWRSTRDWKHVLPIVPGSLPRPLPDWRKPNAASNCSSLR
jgi:PAS domain-containing protein